MTDAPDPDAELEDVEDWEAAPAELAPDEEASHHAILDGRPVVVSAFAGIGGFDLGLQRAGFQTGAVIEWDAAASRVLAARFPNAARFSDVRSVSGESVRRAIGGRPVRVLTGGFPCQDLSVAGRRAGMAGKRSGLYGELLRLAEELDPDWLVVENVPGIFSADADPEANEGDGHGPGSGFALFLGDVTGYRPPVPDGGWRNSGVCSGPLGTCAWRVLDARHFGVAQRRRRMFAVVNTRDRSASAEVLLEPEGVRGDPAARVPSWARAAATAVGAAVRGRPGGPDRGREGDAGAAEDMSPTWTPDLSVPLGALTGGQRQDLEGMTYVPVATNALPADAEGETEVARALVAKGSADPHDYSQSTYVAVEDEVVPGDTAGGIQQYPDGNVALEAHAPTLTRSQDAKIVDGRPVGHIEASGGDDVSPTVTSKWAKGSGGPAGSETGNLVAMRESGQGFWTEDDEAATLRVGGDPDTVVTVVGDGGTDVSHPVTASGTDGMGRGVPAVAYGVAMRGREEGSVPEVTEELVSGLRSASGGSTRDLVLPPGVEVPEGYELVTIPEDDIDDEVERRLAEGGAVAFDWAAGGSGDRSWRGKARSWIVRKGDYAGALSTTKVQAVAYVESVTGEQTHALTSEGADASEDGTGRGTPIVPYAPDVAAPLTAGSHSPGVSAPGRRQEDDVNVVATAIDLKNAVDRPPGSDGDRLASYRPDPEGPTPTLSTTGLQPAVATYRKARRAATDTDDETWVEADHANTLNTFDGGDARATEVVVETPAYAVHTKQDPIHGEEFSPALGASSAGQAVTVNANQSPRVDVDGTGPVTTGKGQSTQAVTTPHAAVRRLTPRECERLQGFPDDWTLVPDGKGKAATDSPRYKQLGNAVCVNVPEWLGCRILDHDDGLLG